MAKIFIEYPSDFRQSPSKLGTNPSVQALTRAHVAPFLDVGRESCHVDSMDCFVRSSGCVDRLLRCEPCQACCQCRRQGANDYELELPQRAQPVPRTGLGISGKCCTKKPSGSCQKAFLIAISACYISTRGQKGCKRLGASATFGVGRFQLYPLQSAEDRSGAHALLA